MDATRDRHTGTSLTIQWLRLPASNVWGVGSVPDGGTKIPHAMRCSKTKPNQGLEITILWEVTQKKKTHVI